MGQTSRRPSYKLLIIFLISLGIKGYAQREGVKLLFTGDILLSRQIEKEINYRGESPWRDLKGFFGQYNLVVGSLEGALGLEDTTRQAKDERLCFKIKSRNLQWLQNAGFHFLTLETNHSADGGEASKNATCDSLYNRGIAAVTFDHSPLFKEVNGIIIAFVAINTIPGRYLKPDTIPSFTILQKLRMASKMADFVVVSIHWGNELVDWPGNQQREMATWLTANGADLVIGHHPHVIQCHEVLNGKPVYYSLGNHLFDQKYPETKTGLMVEVAILRNAIECSEILTHTGKGSFYPELTNEQHKNTLVFEKAMHPMVINGYSLRPYSDFRTGKVGLTAWKSGVRLWTSMPKSFVTLEHASFGENGSLFALERHYSSIDQKNDLRPYVYAVDKFGLKARWRGSALAWPMLDAFISPIDHRTLCAWHRDNSFLIPDQFTNGKRFLIYQWNGFGFKGICDTSRVNIHLRHDCVVGF